MYELLIPGAIAKDVKRLDHPEQRELRDKHFPKLKENPRCGEPLHVTLKGIWSYHFKSRSTQYRNAYQIMDKELVVLLVMIGKRGDFYEALSRRMELW